MVRKKEFTPEALAEARRLYEQTLAPVDDIAATLGLAPSNFYKRLKTWKWARRRAAAGTYHFARAVVDAMAPGDEPPRDDAPLPDAGVASAAPATAARDDARAALAARIQRVAEREMDAIERVLDALGPANQAEADRCARTLAGIARTLREITALNQPEDVAAAHEPDDDAVPVDIDELRCELARRLNALIDAECERARGGAGAVSGGDEAARS